MLLACLVLLRSSTINVVFHCVTTSSVPVLSTIYPHTVCSLCEMLGWLKKSSLCALVCGPIENRFSQPALGAELLALRSLPGAYAALVLTKFGDLFYQCWEYSPSSEVASNLTISQCYGMKLWMQEAFSVRKS